MTFLGLHYTCIKELKSCRMLVLVLSEPCSSIDSHVVVRRVALKTPSLACVSQDEEVSGAPA